MEISRGFMWDKETNKPVKKDDDAMENLYRLCLQDLPYIEPSTDADFIPPTPLDIPSNLLSFPSFDVSNDDEVHAAKTRRYASRYPA